MALRVQLSGWLGSAIGEDGAEAGDAGLDPCGIVFGKYGCWGRVRRDVACVCSSRFEFSQLEVDLFGRWLAVAVRILGIHMAEH